MSLRIKDTIGFFSRWLCCFILLLVVSLLKSLPWQRNRCCKHFPCLASAADYRLVLANAPYSACMGPLSTFYIYSLLQIQWNKWSLTFRYLFFTFSKEIFYIRIFQQEKHRILLDTFFPSGVAMEFLRTFQVLCTWNSRLDLFITPIFWLFLIVVPSCWFLPSFHMITLLSIYRTV